MTTSPPLLAPPPDDVAPFVATTAADPAGQVLRLSGELDLASVGELSAAARRTWPLLYEPSDTEEACCPVARRDVRGDLSSTVRVDISDLRFADVARLRELRDLDVRARAHGTGLRVTGARPDVRRVMRLCQCDWAAPRKTDPSGASKTGVHRLRAVAHAGPDDAGVSRHPEH